MLGWIFIPVMRKAYQTSVDDQASSRSQSKQGEDMNAPPVSSSPSLSPYRPAFEEANVYFVLHRLSGMARIALVVYAVDVVGVVACELELETFSQMWKNGLSQSVGVVLFTTWVLDSIRRSNTRLVFQPIAHGPSTREGKANLVNNLLDAVLVIYVIALIVLAQLLSFNMGIALSSLFAFGGSAILIFGLASKDIAQELLSGLALTIGDKFHHGEEVVLENGKTGYIETIGWTHTNFRCKYEHTAQGIEPYKSSSSLLLLTTCITVCFGMFAIMICMHIDHNELLVRIPNSELHGKSVASLSRGKMCQVKQTLRINHSDVDKIDNLLHDIKDEVLKATTPDIIPQGQGRPFRAHLRDMEDDHLSVVCEFHFNIRPSGDVYWDNRQRTLQAIQRALRRNAIQLVSTTSFGSALNERKY
jgi:small-conductance mechanosensitive channel